MNQSFRVVSGGAVAMLGLVILAGQASATCSPPNEADEASIELFNQLNFELDYQVIVTEQANRTYTVAFQCQQQETEQSSAPDLQVMISEPGGINPIDCTSSGSYTGVTTLNNNCGESGFCTYQVTAASKFDGDQFSATQVLVQLKTVTLSPELKPATLPLCDSDGVDTANSAHNWLPVDQRVGFNAKDSSKTSTGGYSYNDAINFQALIHAKA